MVHSIAVAPAFEPDACRKISIIGKCVGEFRAWLTLPIAKSKAIKIPNASVPLITIDQKMTFGMVVAASLTSSLRCIAPSKPDKE